MSGKLTQRQREIFSRNILVPEIGETGQAKLLAARVLVVGAGGLGSPAILYLAANGIGTVGIADPDRVELSNLQRQILHGTGDVGMEKTASAAETLRRNWPDTGLELHTTRVDADNGGEILESYDFIIEATDNFAAKFTLNDLSVRGGKPLSSAGILGMYGQAMTVLPGQGPCFRCVFKEEPPQGQVPTTADEGVLGPVPGVMGAIQAIEAIKYITGAGRLLTGRLLTFDALDMALRTAPLPAEGRCDLCREIYGNGE